MLHQYNHLGNNFKFFTVDQLHNWWEIWWPTFFLQQGKRCKGSLRKELALILVIATLAPKPRVSLVRTGWGLAIGFVYQLTWFSELYRSCELAQVTPNWSSHRCRRHYVGHLVIQELLFFSIISFIIMLISTLYHFTLTPDNFVGEEDTSRKKKALRNPMPQDLCAVLYIHCVNRN